MDAARPSLSAAILRPLLVAILAAGCEGGITDPSGSEDSAYSLSRAGSGFIVGWSRDSRIVYLERLVGGGRELEALDAVSANARLLARFRPSDHLHDVLETLDRRWLYYRMEITGGEYRQEVQRLQTHGEAPPEVLFGWTASRQSRRLWASPAGQAIAVDDGDWPSEHLLVQSAGGDTLTLLSFESGTSWWTADWEPDGRRLLVRHRRPEGGCQAFFLDPSSSVTTSVGILPAGSCASLIWRSDGPWVTSLDGLEQRHLLTGEERRLGPLPTEEGFATIAMGTTGDGRMLLFRLERCDRWDTSVFGGQICVDGVQSIRSMEADGGKVEEIARFGGHLPSYVDWAVSPDGCRVVLSRDATLWVATSRRC